MRRAPGPSSVKGSAVRAEAIEADMEDLNLRMNYRLSQVYRKTNRPKPAACAGKRILKPFSEHRP
jgi:hypothetical protein